MGSEMCIRDRIQPIFVSAWVEPRGWRMRPAMGDFSGDYQAMVAIPGLLFDDGAAAGGLVGDGEESEAVLDPQVLNPPVAEEALNLRRGECV